MAWENVIIGYRYTYLEGRDALIPIEAKYIEPYYETVMAGWISNLHPVKTIIGHRLLMPVYRKKNVKKSK